MLLFFMKNLVMFLGLSSVVVVVSGCGWTIKDVQDTVQHQAASLGENAQETLEDVKKTVQETTEWLRENIQETIKETMGTTVDDHIICLQQKSLTLYGATSDGRTHQQKALLGSVQDQFSYVDCDTNQAICDQQQIKQTPLWRIADGSMLQWVYSMTDIATEFECFEE